MLEQLLKQLGFNEKEILVYLAILKSRQINPQKLTEITKLKRTTVYSVVKELIRKGTIAEDKAAPTMMLVALPPEDLEKLVQKEEEALEEKKYLISQSVKELLKIEQSTLYPVPKLNFIPEIDMKYYIKKQTQTWSESIMAADGIYWGFQDPSYAENYAEEIDYYWNHKSAKDVTLYLLTNESDIEEKMQEKKYERQIIKFWNKSEPFASTTWVMGNYVAILRTHVRPHYLVEHHDPELAKNLRQLFKWVWEKV